MTFCTHCRQPLPDSEGESHPDGSSLNAFNENEEPAGLFRRIMARIIDYQIILLFFLLFNHLTSGTISSDLHWYSKSITAIPSQPWTLMLVLWMFAGYFIIFHSTGGQTPGKLLLCIRLTRLRNPSPPGFLRNFLRETFWLLSLLPGALPLLILLFSKSRRGLHDRLGVSIVKRV